MFDEPPAFTNVEMSKAAELLAKVPRLGSRIRRFADELSQAFPALQILPPDSPQDLSFALGRSSQGFEPLLEIIPLRPDFFPDVPATRSLLFYLGVLCRRPPADIGETPKIIRRIREAQENLEYRQPLDRYMIRQAFLTTLDRRQSGDRRVAETSLPETVAEVIDDLIDLDGPEFAVLNVLDFLGRLAKLCAPGDAAVTAALRSCLAGLVDGLGTYERELAEIDKRMDLWQASALRRIHLLVRVELEMDCDPEDAVDDQGFTVTIWQYTDDQYGYRQPPYERERGSHKKDASPVGGPDLISAIRTKFPRAANDRTVVELMVDDAVLGSAAMNGVIDSLSQDYLVVIRPRAASTDLRRWFANWQAVLQETDFGAAVYDGAGFDEPPTSSALVVDARRPPAQLPGALLAAGVPIAAWKRGGGAIEEDAVSCVRAKFDTPELFQHDRRNGQLPKDAVLMWHNPHWFPDGPALQWRGGPA